MFEVENFDLIMENTKLKEEIRLLSKGLWIFKVSAWAYV